MNIIENMVQGSETWHQLRSERFTASEAAAVFGHHKYMSRNDLLKLKHTGVQPEVSASQQRIFNAGHEAEAAARPIAEDIIGSELYPCTVEDDSQTYLASMDGLDMLGEKGFEHKLASEGVIQQVREGDLEDHYKWQMDHQMMVTGASKILFMTSDGTRERCEYMWYERDEERIQRLLAGWEQFRQDIADYQPTEQKVAPQGEAPETLPALQIDLTGMVKASNLPEFKSRALAMIDGIKTKLTTDKDFADAESTVKFLQKGEKQLEASKKAALEQTASIAELFDTIDELKEKMRAKRLDLNKRVTAEKENRRLEIQQKAEADYSAWLDKLDSPVKLASVLNVAGAMKGKKTIATLTAAADDEVARAKVEAQQEARRLADNKALIEKHQGDYAFLFSDWRDLIQRDADFIKLQVENRIAHHKQEEQKKLDAERERIRQEEEAKARREAAEKARQEDEAKAKQETDALAAQEEDAIGAQEAEAASHGVNHKPIDTSRLTQAAGNFQRGSDVAKPEAVEIPRKEYELLLSDREVLHALEDAGVAHWSGYEKALAKLEAA